MLLSNRLKQRKQLSLFKRKLFPIIAFTLAFMFETAYGNVEKEQSKKELDEKQILRISEAFGHLISKNLDSLGFQFDMAHLIKGIQDASLGVAPPMEEKECIEAISLLQEEAFQKLAAANLKKAELFMEKNAKNAGIVELEKNKLQYKIEKEGQGAVVEELSVPMIRCLGKLLNQEGQPQSESVIHLDEATPVALTETIEGLRQGLLGMKEGEKRTLYIHPELGYGTNQPLNPNETLILEVEVIQAHSKPEEEEAITAISNQESQEIAIPEGKRQEALR